MFFRLLLAAAASLWLACPALAQSLVMPGERALTPKSVLTARLRLATDARAAITAPEAGSLRLAIELCGVPEDVEMVFFGSGGARLEGPVRVGDISDRTRAWWSPLTEGATQTVEFFVPQAYEPRSLSLSIT